MSIHEEATVFAEGPMMGVFSNLVIYDQHVPQIAQSAGVDVVPLDRAIARYRAAQIGVHRQRSLDLDQSAIEFSARLQASAET